MDMLCHVAVEDSEKHLILHLQHGHIHAAGTERFGHFQSDQPAADNNRPRTRFYMRGNIGGIIHIFKAQTPASSLPGNGGTIGRLPVANTSASYGIV